MRDQIIAHFKNLSRDDQQALIADLINLKKQNPCILKCKPTESNLSKMLTSLSNHPEIPIVKKPYLENGFVKWEFTSISDRNLIAIECAWEDAS
jgi:hypothetical protein